MPPDEALAGFELEPGYRIELAAAEPLTRDPVAIAFDDRGRLYVVEHRGYPDPPEGSAPSAREGLIALLEDTDGDGRFDKRSNFAGDLANPNGIMPWNGGVFVTSAPDLLYFKDTTGDGVSDERRVVLTGFDATRTAQIRFSHPTLGIDNWVYLTGGLNGGRVTAPEHPERPPVTFAAGDARFNPFSLAFELTGGHGQYGLTFDDYGRRFVCSNRHPVMQVVLEPRYLTRNPHLAFSGTAHEVSTVGAQAVVWPLSADSTTASFHPSLMSTPHAGTFTAASGVHIHRGDALPEGHADSIFICESAQNLVQRQVRSPRGVTFTSRPARTGREFLASRDSWFRPVFAANGPDGALYIVDMYRKTIDHPAYVPEQSRALLDFESGQNHGRIYRIVARGWKGDSKPINLGQTRTGELARTLEHPNAWWRETAQRLLLERGDRSAIPPLRNVAEKGRGEVARIHALWTLEGLGGLEAGDLAKAMSDAHAAVRENGVRLAESRVGASPDMLAHVLRLADDPDDHVRLRVALALGETRDARSIGALASIAHRDGAEPWMRAAILSSVRDRSNEFLVAFAATPSSSRAARAAVMQDLGQLFGAGQTPERCLDLILQIAEPADPGWQAAVLSGIAQGLRARGFAREGRSALMTLLSSDLPNARAARDRVKTILSQAATVALKEDEGTPADLRVAAIVLMGHTDYASAGRDLVSLLDPRHPSEVQVAAVRALSQLPEREAAANLVAASRWPTFTPQVQATVLSVLATEERHLLILLDALEKRTIAAGALGSARWNQLKSHKSAAVQARARALFASVDAGDRMKVYERLRATVLARTRSAGNGRQIFASFCAGCHTFAATGGRMGPDLSGVRNQPAEAILLHTVVPDFEITPGYQGYLVQTRDGRTLSGRLESEAPNSLTLRAASSQQHVILRSEVVSMSASASSLMPNELERLISEQDLADLIGYLKAGPASPAAGGPR